MEQLAIQSFPQSHPTGGVPSVYRLAVRNCFQRQRTEHLHGAFRHLFDSEWRVCDFAYLHKHTRQLVHDEDSFGQILGQEFKP
jgi:hypothetical protein